MLVVAADYGVLACGASWTDIQSVMRTDKNWESMKTENIDISGR